MNLDPETVAGFGHEWTRFDQSRLSDAEAREHFDRYFAVFPWGSLPDDAEGFDLGCGSGRWARLVAPRVGRLHCIDASPDALDIARGNLAEHDNCEFHLASVDALPLNDSSMDFGYSLGVLHHVPDTRGGIESAVKALKPGAPLLLYLYYAFDNRPRWYRTLWQVSDGVRRVISRLPHRMRVGITGVIACVAYWPLARIARVAENLGRNVENFPLAIYRRRSFYSMRTDAYDRFATRLEKRFTRAQVTELMTGAGLGDIRVSDIAPHWCAVGRRRPPDRS